MITFGYKNRFSGLSRAVIALIMGVVMFFTGNSMTIVVYILSAFILASGVMSLVVGLKKNDPSQRPLILVNSGLNIVIAVLMAIFADSLGNFFVGVIGFILFIMGIMQLVVLFSANRTMSVGSYSFVMPVVVLVCGAFLLFRPAFIENFVGYVVGASLMVYGISEIISSIKMRKTMEESRGDSSEELHEIPDAKDVDFEKVDEQ